MSGYASLIRELLVERGATGYDPRHVEAYIRLEHRTLDGLSRKQFKWEVGIAVECIRQVTAEEGIESVEVLANTYGL